MKRHIFLFLIFISTFSFSQRNKFQHKFFCDYQDTEKLYETGVYSKEYCDSIDFKIKLIRESKLKKMKIYDFIFSYNNNFLNFSIGIKDSTVYSFSDNNINNPLLMFSFKKNSPVKKGEVNFFPFTKEFNIVLDELFLSNGETYDVNHRLFIFRLVKKNEVKNLSIFKEVDINTLYFSIKQGFMIEVFDIQKKKYFSNLK